MKHGPMITEEIVLNYLVHEKRLNEEFEMLLDGHSFNPRITGVSSEASGFIIVIENCRNRDNIRYVQERIGHELCKANIAPAFKIIFPHSA
jgi:hypothetical protein